MSCFLDILRWILFCGEDETRYDRSSSYYSYDRSSLYSSTTLSSSSRQTSSQSSSPYRSYYGLDDSPPKPSPFTSSSPQTTRAVQPQPSILPSSSVQTQSSSQPQPAAKPSPFSHPPKSSSSSLSKPSPFPPVSSVRVVESQPSVLDPRYDSLLKRYDLLKVSLSSPTSSSKPSPSFPTSVSQTSSKQTTTSAPVTPRLSSSASERYEIPKDLEEQIKRDIVPQVLKRPLSPSTYAEYFAALLYAEDFYIEKWSKFILSEVSLELKRREDFETKRENKKTNGKASTEKKPFVAFDIDKIPERLPYLLSRDFIFVKRVGKSGEPFKGILFRVVKSKWVLVDFANDFHSQHSSSNRYDVSFSFNRVCLKRAHQAVSAAKDHSLHDFLFPEPDPNLSTLVSHTQFNQIPNSTVCHILNHKGPQPYLIEGPLSVLPNQDPDSPTPAELSAMGKIIQVTILKIYLALPNCRVLICAPTNRSCDALMWSLHKGIPTAKLFRANAAFRDYELVPDDIIPQCLYKGECFTCPSLSKLRSFNVISSTYMSSFRLHNAGIDVNHFTHIFLVDASSAVEPEVVVPLASFAGGKPVVVVTGSSHNSPLWVRSDIARKHGLKMSYFERLLKRELYKSSNSMFITHI